LGKKVAPMRERTIKMVFTGLTIFNEKARPPYLSMEEGFSETRMSYRTFLPLLLFRSAEAKPKPQWQATQFARILTPKLQSLNKGGD